MKYGVVRGSSYYGAGAELGMVIVWPLGFVGTAGKFAATVDEVCAVLPLAITVNNWPYEASEYLVVAVDDSINDNTAIIRKKDVIEVHNVFGMSASEPDIDTILVQREEK